MKELIKTNKVELAESMFDFSKIRAIPEVKNIWGVWEQVHQVHKTVNASYGSDVDKDPSVDLSNATALNIKLEFEGKLYTVTLSKDGRVSTKTIIPHEKLIEIFDNYFSGMLK